VRACLLVPSSAEYPYGAIVAGLHRLGCTIERSADADLLVTWSPWKGTMREAVARQFARNGKPVIVAENGFLSPLGGKRYFQLALDGWNGTGRFPAGDAMRWRRWGLPLLPWRRRGDQVLVIGQRGHPEDDRTATQTWHLRVEIETTLPVLRRARGSTVPLEYDIADAAECHVWTSSAASWAVIAGVPVIQHGPNLMVSELASRPGDDLRRPGDRQAVLERLAWAQWAEDEIHTGEPLARLLA
jgi:hypothetical protein